MRRGWEPEDLIASGTLLDDDWRLVGNKTAGTRLGFALILKFFAIEARFPRHAGEVPKAAVDYVAGQVKVDPVLCGWDRNTAERGREPASPLVGLVEG